VNNELSTLISLPCAIFMLITMVDVIVVVCIVIFLKSKITGRVLVFFFYCLSICLYTCYIVRLNQHIQRCFSRICVHLRERHLPDVQSKTKSVTLSVNWKNGQSLRQYGQSHHRHRSKDNRESCQIRLYELTQYRDMFNLRLFYLTHIDMSVLFSMVLVMLGYIVFIAQTTGQV